LDEKSIFVEKRHIIKKIRESESAKSYTVKKFVLNFDIFHIFQTVHPNFCVNLTQNVINMLESIKYYIKN